MFLNARITDKYLSRFLALLCLFLALTPYQAQAKLLAAYISDSPSSSVPEWIAKETGLFKKYGLDVEIAVAAKNQAKGGKISAREAQQRSHADALRTRDQEISELRHRCEEMVARICLAEGNAQRIGIDPVELWKPLAAPDRSIPHPGGKWNNRRRESCENSQR